MKCLIICVVLAVGLLFNVGCEVLEPIELDPIEEVADQDVRIGITHPSHDNVGQVLMFFGGGVNFYVLSDDDMGCLDRLSEFYAVFINCGSHHYIQPRLLRAFVNGGGVAYISDLASAPLIYAFPGMMDIDVVGPSMTVNGARITHSSLASHMGVSDLDVVFNMGGWHVVTELADNATTYIQGYIPGHGLAPLALSFNYGDGTVFYTSFHNNAQATSHMVSFIEYLVFRIKFIEADRGLADRAQREGFEYRGAVFGFLGEGETLARAMAVAEAGALMPPTVAMAPGADYAVDADAADAVFSAAAAPQQAQQPFIPQRFFQYTFDEGDDFMLMIEAGVESFKLRLYDPYGNTFYLTERGELISYYPVSDAPVILPEFESIDGHGVLVRAAAGGEWGFVIVADDAANDATFVVGIAIQSR